MSDPLLDVTRGSSLTLARFKSKLESVLQSLLIKFKIGCVM